jgi:hypothetical protein
MDLGHSRESVEVSGVEVAVSPERIARHREAGISSSQTTLACKKTVKFRFEACFHYSIYNSQPTETEEKSIGWFRLSG